jgi:hypothetical protein
MNNPLIHKSKVVRVKLSWLSVHLAPHLPHTPDLAPSNFFLFGFLKEKMLGLEFDSTEQLLHWIRDEFERMLRAFLGDVFESWINRLEKCVQCERDYFPED